MGLQRERGGNARKSSSEQSAEAGLGAACNRRQLLAFGAAAGGLLLAGCASSAPSALYALSAPEIGAEQAGLRRGGKQILVPRPRALNALDSNYVAVVDRGEAYSYFPGIAWADALPDVLQARIVQTLENTGRLGGVGFPGDGLLIDYQLQTELRAFEIRVDGPKRGLVELSAKLVNDRNGRAISTQVFRAETAVSGAGVDQAVAALDASAIKVMAELAAWVLSRT
ncbi:membrane integrity-associated transporter subunit PqiC [Labrenzia suaedae]|uniref:Membrane integrity-associated transporter subunit PqiC n=2 Tax=Roseibium litorale TaxID=2803841 RepID=A0ABR9CI84_9HYPH|nr:ABC-type transport auxiliary lipoprotein family protein [Roseibium litorale]MBD8890448.1 membrane integrity-associated transporter subunit PqiC [Roseibium litorale]